MTFPFDNVTLKEADRIVAYVRAFGEQKAGWVRSQFGLDRDRFWDFIRRNRHLWEH